MAKYKEIAIIFGISVVFSSVFLLGANAISRTQNKNYQECVQDWMNESATLKEAQAQCDMFLE